MAVVIFLYFSLFIQTLPITFLVPSVVDQREFYLFKFEATSRGIIRKTKNNRLLSKLIVFYFCLGDAKRS